MRVSLSGVTKRFGETTAVNNVTTVAEEGELTTLVGPSGCGKTTTLRCIAGLERPDEGTVTIGDQTVADLQNGVFVPTQNRDIGMVFQTFDVWAHLSVFENVAFPLRIRDFSENEIEEKVMNMLELSGIADLRNNSASELSGGQQARVGISRALVYEPKVLLCDEPLTGLDRNLRARMRYEIRDLQQKLGITTVYVTHDQPEAMAISDKICLMRDGRLEQEGSGRDIYDHPKSMYAFDFFGSSQFYNGTRTGSDSFETDFGPIKSSAVEIDDENVLVGFRPQQVQVSANGDSNWTENTWEGTLSKISFLGDVNEYIIDVNGEIIRSRTSRSLPDIDEGDSLRLHIDPAEVHIYPEEKEDVLE